MFYPILQMLENYDETEAQIILYCILFGGSLANLIFIIP